MRKKQSQNATTNFEKRCIHALLIRQEVRYLRASHELEALRLPPWQHFRKFSLWKLDYDGIMWRKKKSWYWKHEAAKESK
jgi:plasmid maintenance system killer protein